MNDTINEPYSSSDPSVESGAIYEIRVKGCLDQGFWSDIFEGMELVIDTDQGETVLRGPITDQAELYGLLTRLRNQGLTLMSVVHLEQEA